MKKNKNSEYTLITGASRGIGLAIAEMFASNGHNLIINSSKKSCEDLLSVAKALTERYSFLDIEVIPFISDISDITRLKCFKEELYKKNPDCFINCIVNNAGISYFGLTQDMTIEDWNTIISTNLTSIFNTTNTFLNQMISNQKGCIINISSVWGICGASCEVAYSASKGGVNAFTKALAKEVAPSHISVNAIACGAIDTSMNSRLSVEEIKELEAEIPYGRMGKPMEVAELAYKIYKTGPYMTGQIITLDGGWI